MNTLIKQLNQITGKNNIASGLPQSKKQKMIARYINPTKYDFVGFVDRTNEVVLRPRYYNVRNKLGQFAAIEE
jgi:hypothetical protein